MKAILLLSFVLLTTLANAQNQVKRLTPEEKAKKETEHAQKQLQLSQEQSDQYERIVLKYNNSQSVINNIPADSAHKRVNKRKEFIKNRNAEIKAILTPEQYAKYRTWMGEDRMELMYNAKRKSDSIQMKKNKH